MDIEIRRPSATDGHNVNQLVESISELDNNSTYCNLLQCSHFSDTSAIAVTDEDTLGFISGYTKPDQPDTLFVWQVAVSSAARGQGLAGKLLNNILERSRPTPFRYIETTITVDNEASWALFRSIARKHDAPLNSSLLFDRSQHFNDQHDSELLARIGPFNSNGQ